MLLLCLLLLVPRRYHRQFAVSFRYRRRQLPRRGGRSGLVGMDSGRLLAQLHPGVGCRDQSVLPCPVPVL